MRAALFLLLLGLPATVGALELELEGELRQGAMVIGRVEPGVQVSLEGHVLRVDQETGTFVFGLGRDAAATARLEVVGPDGAREIRELAVAGRDYDIQRVDGLPPRKVTPSEEDLTRIRREAKLIQGARARDSAAGWFREGFRWPVRGRITGVYGSQRILNGEPRAPHLGVDIAAPRGTPVHAAARGIVTLAETDLFFTGGTVVLDHGHGVSTIYSHLDTVEVDAGAIVAQGEKLGTLGSTGRSTGAHLDWRINWFQVRLDPVLVAGPMPED